MKWGVSEQGPEAGLWRQCAGPGILGFWLPKSEQNRLVIRDGLPGSHVRAFSWHLASSISVGLGEGLGDL